MKKALSLLLAFLLCFIIPSGSTAHGENYPSYSKRKCTFLLRSTTFLGNYDQDDNPITKEPVEWLILDIQDGRALLISKYSLNCRRYNYYDEDTTWEKCTLRGWLNDTFFKQSFSEEEKKSILTTELTADDSQLYITDMNTAKDKIFLLSITEAETYFPDNTERSCDPSIYAAQKNWNSYNSNCWWLRSSGQEENYAAYVHQNGDIDSRGCNVSVARGVRPALWLDLSYLLEICLENSWRYV